VSAAPRTIAGPSILVVEDDDETRAALTRELSGRGYRVVEANDGRTALRRWASRRPDVVLLDLGLPDIDGVDVIVRMRREANTPIVILSGRYDEREKVEALERGADDYVTKPFGVEELNARLRVALRRSGGAGADDRGQLSVGPLVLDSSVHEVRVDGERVELTPSEFLTQNEIDAAKSVQVSELNVQNQQKIVWPRRLVVAKAYIDQLERSQAMPAGKIADIRQAITAAEGTKNNGKLKGYAKSIEKDAATAKNTSDGDRMRALADILKKPEH
jgi:CheY-like chemotaxis protein